MPVSTKQGILIALAGLAMIPLGIMALIHCDASMNVLWGSICVRNDWAAAGGLLLLFGIIVLILGLVLPAATAPAPPAPPPSPYAQAYAYMPVQAAPGYAPGYAQAYPAYAPAYGQAPAPLAPAPQRTCTRCGAPVTAQFCSSCGTQAW